MVGQLALLVLVVTSASFARLTLAPVQESLAAALNLSDAQIGVLQGPALTLPMVIAAIPLGILIDRFPRSRLLMICAISGLIASIATAWAPNYAWLLAARSAAGLAAFAVNPIAYALISDGCAPTLRGRATTAMAIGQTLGVSAAFGIGGVALGVLASGDWRIAMMWLSVPLALGCVAALFLGEPHSARGMQKSVRSTGERMRLLFAHHRILLPLVVGITAMEIILSTTVWMGPSLSRTYGLDPVEVGATMALALLISGLLGPVFGGLIADYCQKGGGAPRAALALAALSFAAIGASFFPWMPTSGVAGTLLVLLLAISSAVCLMTTALFTILVPDGARGLFFGGFVGAVLIFAGVTPLIVSMVAVPLGGAHAIAHAVWLVCFVAAIIGTAAFLVAWQRLTKATAP